MINSSKIKINYEAKDNFLNVKVLKMCPRRKQSIKYNILFL